MTVTQNNTDSSASNPAPAAGTTNNPTNDGSNTNVTESKETQQPANQETPNPATEGDKNPEAKPEEKKPDEQSDSDKKPEDDKKEVEEPADYSKLTFKNPEAIDQELFKEATDIFGEGKIKGETAQKLVQLQEKAIEKIETKYRDDYQKTTEGWKEESQKDPEIGGKNYETNMSVVAKAVKAFGTPEFKKFVDDYGFGNHPEFLRFAYRAGLTVKEDSSGATLGLGGNPPSKSGTRAERMYPNAPSSGQF